MTQAQDYPKEIIEQWKRGEIQELCYFVEDEEAKGTFVKFVDVEIGYLFPSFVCGNEEVYRRYERVLINHAQDNYSF